MTASPRSWSTQQQNVFRFVESGKPGSSALVVAVAGSGKTTTLVEAVRRMSGSVAFLAYNKKIADEIQARVAETQPMASVRCGTFHSFGMSAWRRLHPKVQVEGNKVANIVAGIGLDEIPEEYARFAIKAVSLAKQRAFGVLVPLDDASEWYDMVEHFELTSELTEGASLDEAIRIAQQILKASNAQCDEIIDFDDMIYAPLFFRARIWANDYVLVDEAQDTNPARRALAKRLLKPGGRLIAVGDPHQAIYGFTGADSDSLDLIRKDFGCIDLPLTVTYRCPRAVVALAQQWVEHITAAQSAPEGHVVEMNEERFSKEIFRAEDAILCRNTKPLVSLAYQLLRRGVACQVEGRDIGKGLIQLVNRWRSARTLEQLRERLEVFAQTETAKMMAKGKELLAEAVQDRVDTLFVIMDSLKATEATRTGLINAINNLFGDSDPARPARVLTLSTIHKSKGREWQRVYWYGRNLYQPSKFARQQWQQEQEVNLMYVAATRAQDVLVDVVVAK